MLVLFLIRMFAWKCVIKRTLDDHEVQMYETFLMFSIRLPVEEA